MAWGDLDVEIQSENINEYYFAIKMKKDIPGSVCRFRSPPQSNHLFLVPMLTSLNHKYSSTTFSVILPTD